MNCEIEHILGLLHLLSSAAPSCSVFSRADTYILLMSVRRSDAAIKAGHDSTLCPSFYFSRSARSPCTCMYVRGHIRKKPEHVYIKVQGTQTLVNTAGANLAFIGARFNFSASPFAPHRWQRRVHKIMTCSWARFLPYADRENAVSSPRKRQWSCQLG